MRRGLRRALGDIPRADVVFDGGEAIGHVRDTAGKKLLEVIPVISQQIRGNLMKPVFK